MLSMTEVVTLPAPGRGQYAYHSLRERLGGIRAASVVAVLEEADSFMACFAVLQQVGFSAREASRWLDRYDYDDDNVEPFG